jgi:hypothetical protein
MSQPDSQFDPYYKWLGIAPKDQSPNHYRLLGVDLFEADPETITNAADRQMAHVRTFQTGPHSALSQKLLNEISAARVCLLNPAKKAVYDAKLRAKEVSPPVEAPRAVPPVAPPLPVARPVATAAIPILPIALPVWTPQPSTPVAAEFSPTTSLVLAKGEVRARRRNPLSAVVVGGFMGLLLAVVLGMIGLVTTRAKSDKPAATLPAAVPQAELEITEATWGDGDRAVDITDRVRSLVVDERLVATASGTFFLGVPNPEAGIAKNVRIRYRAAGKPGLVEVHEGEFIYLDGRPTGAGSASSGKLEVIEARFGAGATWLDVLPRVRRWVHGERLSIRAGLVAQADPVPSQRKVLFLRYRTADGEFATHAWESEELEIDARQVALSGKSTDLFRLADPARNSVGARWIRDGASLASPEKSTGNLTFHAAIPEEYVLTAVIEGNPRPSDVGMMLPISDRQVELLLGGDSNTISRLCATAGQNITRSGTVFERDQQTVIRCIVGGSSMRVTCNGRVAIDWAGDTKQLSPHLSASESGKRTIALRGTGVPYRVASLDVTALGASQPAIVKSSAPVDLLKHLDLKLDAVDGGWRITKGGLASDQQYPMRVQFPNGPPNDYELRIVTTRLSGNDGILALK